MKNRCFLESVKCAVRGAVQAFGRERNFRIYLLMMLITVPLNLWMQISLTQWLLLFVCLCGAFSAECLNTALEKLCDLVTQEYSTAVGYIKDVAAGAILWWGIAYFGIELILLGGRIFA